MGTRSPKAESLWGTRGVDMGNPPLRGPKMQLVLQISRTLEAEFPKSSHNCRLRCSMVEPGSPKFLHFVAAAVLRILAIRRFPVHLLKTVER